MNQYAIRTLSSGKHKEGFLGLESFLYLSLAQIAGNQRVLCHILKLEYHLSPLARSSVQRKFNPFQNSLVNHCYNSVIYFNRKLYDYIKKSLSKN